MAKELILRKGTAAQHSTFIGKLAELTVITDTKDLALHDNSTAGGIVLAKKIILDNHMSNINNPHGVTKAQVGLGNVDNTADADKNVLSATKLTTARTISLTGDVTGNVSFDGSANVSITATVAAIDELDANIDLLGINKVDKISGKGLSTEDYTTAEKSKLAGIDTKLPKINPEIIGSITEQVYNLTGTEINPAKGTIQYKNVSSNTTFTESLATGQSVLLRLINASNYTITFPTITWIGVTAPTLTANCAIVIWKEQSTLYGAYLGTLI